jgi:hypothetical protein
MYVLPDLSLSEIILALEGDAVLFPAGMTLRLFTTDITPTRVTVAGDLAELTNVEVPGYAPTTPAWAGTPFRNQDGAWEDWTDQNFFIAAGGPPPVATVVYGWMLMNAGGTVLAGAGRFSDPFTFVADGDGMSLKAHLTVNQVDGTTVEVGFDMVQG